MLRARVGLGVKDRSRAAVRVRVSSRTRARGSGQGLQCVHRGQQPVLGMLAGCPVPSGKGPLLLGQTPADKAAYG